MTQNPRPLVYADIGSRFYAYLLAGVTIVVILSGIGASKGVMIGPVITDAAFFLFPLAYILGDVITEVYGPAAARRAIIVGFVANVTSVGVYQLIIVLPGFTDDYGLAKQQALETALGPVWQVVLAGLLGYAAGQSLNSFTMWLGKRRHGERGLFGRLLSATGLGEAVDTIVFCTVAATAIGISTIEQWANYTFFGFLYKTLVQYAAIPLTALAIRRLKKHEPTYQARLHA